MARKTVIFTVGPPGSGKTSWAGFLHGRRDAIVIERDAFRIALFGSKVNYFRFRNDIKIYRRNSFIVGSAMASAMRAALDDSTVSTVVLCDTNIHYSSVERFVGIAERHPKTDMKVVRFDVPWSELKLRNETRPIQDRIPIDDLVDSFKAFHNSDKRWYTSFKFKVETIK